MALLAAAVKRATSMSRAFSPILRCMSNVPENTVYGGPKPQNPDQRVTVTHLKQKHKKGEPITMVTAYDYPSAVHLDSAGIDICLVGDSAAMVVHGYDTTLPITLDEMLVHCRAVARGAKRPLLVGDLPFGFYESSSNQAVDTAVRVLKEGGMDAIKLEGGAPSRITAAKSIVEAGIAVMGHVGLTPQAISVLGGFRPQGRNVASAVKVVETALALQEAGCFSVVLECVPPPVAKSLKMSPNYLLVFLVGVVVFTTSTPSLALKPPIQKPPSHNPPNHKTPTPLNKEEPFPFPEKKPPTQHNEPLKGKGERPPPKHKPPHNEHHLLEVEGKIPEGQKPPQEHNQPPKGQKPPQGHNEPPKGQKPPQEHTEDPGFEKPPPEHKPGQPGDEPPKRGPPGHTPGIGHPGDEPPKKGEKPPPEHKPGHPGEQESQKGEKPPPKNKGTPGHDEPPKGKKPPPEHKPPHNEQNTGRRLLEAESLDGKLPPKGKKPKPPPKGKPPTPLERNDDGDHKPFPEHDPKSKPVEQPPKGKGDKPPKGKGDEPPHHDRHLEENVVEEGRDSDHKPPRKLKPPTGTGKKPPTRPVKPPQKPPHKPPFPN